MSVVTASSLADITSVQKASPNKLVVVYTWASWDAPAQQLEEVMQELAAENTEAAFFKVDADAAGGQDICKALSLSCIPCVATYLNLKLQGMVNGFAPADTVALVEGGAKVAAETPAMSAEEALTARLTALVSQAPVMLFMKGSPAAPRCGFSRQIVEILAAHKVSYDSFDILSDSDVREGLKKFSKWPTYPQLYGDGELLGGLDVVKEMVANGEFVESLPAAAVKSE